MAWLVLVHLPIAAAGWCAPHPPNLQHREHAASGPSASFPLGTDDLGRDVSARLLHGARLSLAAALAATVLALGVALAAGALAGARGGWVDAALSWATETAMAVPWVFVLLAVRAALPLHLPPEQAFVVVVGLTAAVGWPAPARLVRGVVAHEARQPYVMAAAASGATPLRILAVHLLPSAVAVVVAQALVLFPQFVLAEVTLSFLGLGMPEPTASLGTLLADARSQAVLGPQPWRLAPAGLLAILLFGYQALAARVRPA